MKQQREYDGEQLFIVSITILRISKCLTIWWYFILNHLIFMSEIVINFAYYSGTLILYSHSLDTFICYNHNRHRATERYDNNWKVWYLRFDNDNKMSYKNIILITWTLMDQLNTIVSETCEFEDKWKIGSTSVEMNCAVWYHLSVIWYLYSLNHWGRVTLQIMAYRPDGAKPLSGPMLNLC